MSGQTEYITKGSSQFTALVNLLQDNSGTNPGDPLTGITSTASGLVCYYKSGATGAVTSLSLTTLASTDAFSIGGFAQLSSANMPGAYRLDLSTTLFSSGDNVGQVLLSGYVDLAAHAVHVKFTDLDFYSSMQTELATYGPSTHTSTDISDLNPTNFNLMSLSTDGEVTIDSTSVDLIWDEPLTGGTHNVATSAGKRLRQIDAAFEVHSGTAQAGTSTTITLDTGADGTNDNIYRGDRCVIIAGTGIGEHDIIVSYTASSRVATVAETWIVTPDNTSEFILVPASVDIETWQHTVVTNGGASGLPAVDAQAISNSSTSADDLQANIGNLDAAVSGCSIHTSTAITDALNTYGGSTHTSTAITDALNTYGPSTHTTTDINDQVKDVIFTDTLALIGQVAPSNTPTIAEALGWLYKLNRNLTDNDGNTTQLYDDAGTTVDQKQATSVTTDDVVSKAEWVTGP